MPREAATAAELLDFWLERRLAMIVLLDKAAGPRFAAYPAAFVERLVTHATGALDGAPPPPHEEILRLVFDNTRKAIVRILAAGTGREQAGALIAAFWSYQLPGLRGLMAYINANLPKRRKERRMIPDSNILPTADTDAVKRQAIIVETFQNAEEKHV